MTRHTQRPPVVPTLQKRVLYVSLGLLFITGVIWLGLGWWARPAGYLGAVPAPGQPFLMKIHGLVAIGFLLIFGVMLFEHIPAGWTQTAHLPSGLGVLISCGILVLTGWGLYYFAGEDLRRITSNLHVVLGLLLPIFIVAHVRAARSKPAHPRKRTQHPVIP